MAMQRRDVLCAGSACLAGWIVSSAGAQTKADPPKPEPVRIAPPEYLLREHAVLERILVIYETGAQRLSTETFSTKVLSSAADLIRDVIEDHHMRLEEAHVFARFQQRNQQMNLVQTLVSQHRAAREVTDTIRDHANERSLRDNTRRGMLIAALQSYVRLSRPHDAHEGSTLFPQFHAILSAHESDAVAEEFERAERRKFGADGYERVVAQIAQLETQVNLADLSQFTPRPPATTGNR
jgi:hemerythrin-like domain-containing protein